MKHLIIIGARGFGREVFDFVHNQPDYCAGKYDIKGFLDDKSDALDGYRCSYGEFPPILGPVETYEPLADDIFFCALGDAHWRKVYAEKIICKGGKFISLIARGAWISPAAKIGEGCFISGWTTISNNVDIGAFSIVHPFCDFGHDVKIGMYCTIEAYSFFGGYSQIGDGSTMHVRSSIIPHKRIGRNCVVATGAAVMRNFSDGVHLMGNPAKRFDF